ncbi:MAG TPA: hypothetical protein VES20_07260 [Bryobacteraceae bacterium]|nr:hypothetical protein [Bryobacteraceae bacterium]
MKFAFIALLFAGGLSAQTCQVLELPGTGSVDGALSESDCTVKDFVRAETTVFKADAYKLTVPERGVVRVRMLSTEVDSFLYVLNRSGAVLVRDNNSGGGRNAEIHMQFAAGDYTVVAMSASGSVGPYQLQLDRERVRSCTPAAIPESGIDADLTETDCRELDLALFTSNKAAVDIYNVSITRSSVLTVRMNSTALDAVLSIHDRQGRRIAADNNSGGGTNALLTISLNPGDYTLRASSARATTGTYNLSSQTSERRSCTAVPLTPDAAVAGELTAADCRFLDFLVPAALALNSDHYRVSLKQRTIVRFSMKSGAIDPGLVLFDSNYQYIAENDDISDLDFDSELVLSLNAGEYHLVATDFYQGLGKYQISMKLEPIAKCGDLRVDAPATLSGTIAPGSCRVMDLISPSDDTRAAAPFTMKTAERSVVSMKTTAGDKLEPRFNILDLVEGFSYLSGGEASDYTMLMPAGTWTGYVVGRTGGTGAFTFETTTRPPAPCASVAIQFDSPLKGEFTSSDCLVREIVPHSTSTVRGQLLKVTATTAGALNLSVESAGIPQIVMFDSEMKIIGFGLNEALAPVLRAEWNAFPGTYYALILPLNGTGGAYTATLSVPQTPSRPVQ